jgi:Pvc16 N-terminal domain
VVVSLNTPKEMIDKSLEGVSVWLYRVIQDEETLNAPPQRQGFGSIKRIPLPMRLHYLITPIVDKKDPIRGPEKEQFILGKILQIFHDCPKLRGADLKDDYSGTEVELNVRLESLNLEEITRIWEAVEGSYQLSVSYEVGVVNIESGIEPERVAPVTVVLPEQGVIVSS